MGNADVIAAAVGAKRGGWRPGPAATLELSLYVVGLPYENKGPGSRLFEVAASEPGQPVELRPEPTNKADPRAVAVYSCRGIQMGYITAERASMVSARLETGEPYEAIFQAAGPSAAVIRVRFGGGAPTLPGSGGGVQRHAGTSQLQAGRAGHGGYSQTLGRRDAHDIDAFYADPEPGEWGA